MKISTLYTISLLIRILALFSSILVVIPILFPLTFIICVIINIFGFFLFSSIENFEKKIKSKHNKKRMEGLLLKTTSNTKKAVRISIFAFSTTFLLYFLLNVHVYVCYRRSLAKDIEPLKEEYRKFKDDQNFENIDKLH